jgi:hypothetical protein
MPADAEPVSVAEVTAFLADTLRLTRTGPGIDPAEWLAFIERKADLLTRIAAQNGTDEAHAVAQDAREQLAQLRTTQSEHRGGGA